MAPSTLSVPQLSPWPSLALTLLPTQIPSSSALAQATAVTYPPANGFLAFAAWAGAQRRIWIWEEGVSQPFAITPNSEDAHDPEISRDGQRIAYASHRTGNWEIFMLNISDGISTQLTHSNDFVAYPTWSPDSQFIAYEHLTGGHIQICILPISGTSPDWCGPQNMDSFEPHWASQGRMIVFTGRTGLQKHTDIYSLDLNTMSLTNLTNTPDADEHRPVFSPDSSRVAYAVETSGYSWVETAGINPSATPSSLQVQGEWPAWSPDGTWLVGVYQPTTSESYILFYPSDHSIPFPPAQHIPERVDRITWTGSSLPDPLPAWLQSASADIMTTPAPTPAFGGPLSHTLTAINVTAPDPRLSDAVTNRFADLRSDLQAQTGWDYLSTLDSAVVSIATPLSPGDQFSWLRTGRAFAIARDALAKGWLMVVPEYQGSYTFWRIYLRATRQDGTQGEPLRDLPWDFSARSSKDPEAVSQGGTLFDSVPAGFFIDFTQIASVHGWQREPADANWRTFYPGIRYWEFVCSDNLDWYRAMNEIYPMDAFLTATPTNTASWPTSNWGPYPSATRWPSPTMLLP